MVFDSILDCRVERLVSRYRERGRLRLYTALAISALLLVGSLFIYMPAIERGNLRRTQQQELEKIVATAHSLEEELSHLTERVQSLSQEIAPSGVAGVTGSVPTERFLQILGDEAARSGFEISSVADLSQHPSSVVVQRTQYEVTGHGSYAELKQFSKALVCFGKGISLRAMHVSLEASFSEAALIKVRLVLQVD